MTSGVGTAKKTAFRGGLEPVSSTMAVYEIDPLRDSRWKVFVESHPQASVFHTTSWLKALRTAYGYDPVVVTSCPPEMPLRNGLVFCGVQSWLTGKRFVSLPFSDYCEPLVNDPNELDDLLLHMRKQVDTGGCKYVEIRPTLSQPRSGTGFGKSVVYCSHRLKLTGSSQELFRNFSKSCTQRKIRRAEREKLRYDDGSSEALLQKFYQLLVMTRRRQFLPPQPLSWFRALITEFGSDLRIRVASKCDTPIASILTITHKKSMVYKYGCSDARFHKLGGVALLFWNAIQEANSRGLEELEMGRSEPRNPGLIAFKEHWGASRTEISYWRYPDGPGMKPGNVEQSVLRKTIPLVPDFVLKAVGEMLYRHVG
jgi:Acetyltransferase (GNAT) domain